MSLSEHNIAFLFTKKNAAIFPWQNDQCINTYVWEDIER